MPSSSSSYLLDNADKPITADSSVGQCCSIKTMQVQSKFQHGFVFGEFDELILKYIQTCKGLLIAKTFGENKILY